MRRPIARAAQAPEDYQQRGGVLLVIAGARLTTTAQPDFLLQPGQERVWRSRGTTEGTFALVHTPSTAPASRQVRYTVRQPSGREGCEAAEGNKDPCPTAARAWLLRCSSRPSSAPSRKPIAGADGFFEPDQLGGLRGDGRADAGWGKDIPRDAAQRRRVELRGVQSLATSGSVQGVNARPRCLACRKPAGQERASPSRLTADHTSEVAQQPAHRQGALHDLQALLSGRPASTWQGALLWYTTGAGAVRRAVRRCTRRHRAAGRDLSPSVPARGGRCARPPRRGAARRCA